MVEVWRFHQKKSLCSLFFLSLSDFQEEIGEEMSLLDHPKARNCLSFQLTCED